MLMCLLTSVVTTAIGRLCKSDFYFLLKPRLIYPTHFLKHGCMVASNTVVYTLWRIYKYYCWRLITYTITYAKSVEILKYINNCNSDSYLNQYLTGVILVYWAPFSNHYRGPSTALIFYLNLSIYSAWTYNIDYVIAFCYANTHITGANET